MTPHTLCLYMQPVQSLLPTPNMDALLPPLNHTRSPTLFASSLWLQKTKKKQNGYQRYIFLFHPVTPLKELILFKLKTEEDIFMTYTVCT